MRHIALTLALVLCAWAGASRALPQIVLYNYTPPVPQLMMTSVVPADHQELSVTPKAVAVYFSVPIDGNQSGLTVSDPYNNPVAHGMSPAQGNGMTLTLPGKLLSGVYRVDWKATCACKAHNMVTGTSYFTID